MNTEKQTIESLIESLNLSLKCSAPKGGREEDWYCIKYECSIFRSERIVWGGTYRLGVGYINKRYIPYPYCNKNHILNRCLFGNCNPIGNSVDKYITALGEVAARQKLKPSLASVLHSLILDGSAYFDALTFEDWCDGLGYPSDSIKARKMYDECDDTGRRLARAFTTAELDSLRAALQDF